MGGDGKQVGQEIPEHLGSDDHKDEGDEKSSSEAKNQGKEEEAVIVLLIACALAAPNPAPTIVKQMEEMFLRLGVCQAVVLKLVDDQGIDSPWTLASLSNEDIAAIYNVIHRPVGLVSGKTSNRGNQISVLAATNLKLAVFTVKTMKHCSRDNICALLPT